MTDSELLRLLRSIDAHQEKIRKIIDLIEESDRTDAQDIANDLKHQCYQLAWAEHVGGHYLSKLLVLTK